MTNIPAETVLQYLEDERKHWEGVNADRYYQTSRVIGFVRTLVSHRQGISENAQLNNEACDSERKRCEHVIVEDDCGSAICIKCSKDFGWYCQISTKHFCEYEGDECCIHCGAPEERQ